MRDTLVALLLAAAAIGGAIALIISIDNGRRQYERERAAAPCSAFANDEVRRVPARCLGFFQDGGP